MKDVNHYYYIKILDNLKTASLKHSPTQRRNDSNTMTQTYPCGCRVSPLFVFSFDELFASEVCLSISLFSLFKKYSINSL